MRAIDVHSHLSTQEGSIQYSEEVRKGMEAYYRFKTTYKTEDEMAQDFRQADVKGLIIAWDSEHNMGTKPVPSDYVAKLCDKYPDVFIGGWCCVDPWRGKGAVNEIERSVKELGMMGVKFQGIAQAFFPDDPMMYPLYETIVALDVPVMFHTGTTGIGAGSPGGGGFKLKYTRPIPHMDDIAADFPKMKIIMAHYGWPWQDEQIAVLLHKNNVYCELSGWSPKYFSDSFRKEVGGRLQDKFMFGTDYPVLSPERLINDYHQVGFTDQVLEKVLYKNAIRILNLKL
ncbi:MAG: amidohydrolase [Candidatus Tectomicrobia bacterium]|uniref:Amidohydrolase n=1 Tax=Tectimicrobiota bacterium TaxID=2528274 RepID=A0A933GQ58_UNCTE|nr:amidohydrolase [Candidatus Tectomicrobia bacterium]